MNNMFYSKLAIANIKKNKNVYVPFFISATMVAALFYTITNIRDLILNIDFFGANSISSILDFGIICIGFFSLVILFYINSFVMKSRKRELGLYNVLGMDKKNIGKVIFLEVIIMGIISIISGIILGMLLSKVMFLVFLNLTHFSTAIKFEILFNPIYKTVVVFAGIFVLVMIYNRIKLNFLKPIELLHSSNVGEREPKVKWLVSILGVASLGLGYYLSVTCESVLKALPTFFFAVILVIIGTYLCFISASIAILKLLKRNKKYYYHKIHFITVSGMLYRMKRNAAGLASICILSTMVLVTLSTTVCTYMGLEDTLRKHNDRDIVTNYLYQPDIDLKTNNGKDGGVLNKEYDRKYIESTNKSIANKYNVALKDIKSWYSMNLLMLASNSTFSIVEPSPKLKPEDVINLSFIMLEDYNKFTNSDEKLRSNEVIVLNPKGKPSYSYDKMEINSTNKKEYSVIKTMEDDNKLNNYEMDNLINGYLVVVRDLKELRDLTVYVDKGNGGYSAHTPQFNYNYNLEGSEANKAEFIKTLRDGLNDADIAHVATVQDIYSVRRDYYSVFGSILFIGCFLGVLFLITTVMIIYYKQLSEGYEDAERFAMMKNVGMSNKEAKKVIKSQIICVFSLPIIVAVIHIIFAFNVINQLLTAISLTNKAMFILCTIGTILVFTMIYGIVYMLTAKTYYKIVKID